MFLVQMLLLLLRYSRKCLSTITRAVVGSDTRCLIQIK